jgi:hypothetical protein
MLRFGKIVLARSIIALLVIPALLVMAVGLITESITAWCTHGMKLYQTLMINLRVWSED